MLSLRSSLMSTNSPLILLLTSLTGTTGNSSPKTNGDGSWGLAVPSSGGRFTTGIAGRYLSPLPIIGKFRSLTSPGLPPVQGGSEG